MRSIGAFVTTSEAALFKLMRDKQHPAFKFVSKLSREPTKDTFNYNLSKLWY
jgi:hypothetical protein